MENGNHDRRLDKLESNSPRPRDTWIQVHYVRTVLMPDGQKKEEVIPATYAEVNWDAILPDADGSRFVVQYPLEDPCSENQTHEKEASD